MTDNELEPREEGGYIFRRSFVVQCNPASSVQAIVDDADPQKQPGRRQILDRHVRARGLQPAGKPRLESWEVIHRGLNTATVRLDYAIGAERKASL
jgi:hypothetical protein